MTKKRTPTISFYNFIHLAMETNVTAGRTWDVNDVTFIVDPSTHHNPSSLTGFVAQHYATAAFDPDIFRMIAQPLDVLLR